MNQFDTTVTQLRSGCLFCFLAHAISVSNWTVLEHEQGWWEDNTYSRSDTQGALGHIRFGEGTCVGVVFDTHSDRFTNSLDKPERYVAEAPDWAKSIALELAPQWFFDPNDREKGTYPAVTSVFWGDPSGVFSCDNMDAFVGNGGHLFRYQMAPYAIASAEFKEEYELTENQSALLDLLYERLWVQRAAEVTLSPGEVALLGSMDAAGEAATRRCLAQIGVMWES
ncbi:MAG: hypothetical protein BWY76_00606 [bacterium ADurb.Bin429]|nr:MAG: hypothetical protein BWY76_00606 [bacterium ADurb.Bin429]